MKQEIEQKTEMKPIKKEDKNETIIRIMHTDIPGRKNVYVGLSRIKGISFSMANAICKILKLDRRKKVQELSGEEIKTISEMVENPKVPNFLKNRRKDFDSGEDKHLVTTNLELRKEFDIKRLRKIRAYRGMRHALGLPSRGQRTKSHFRKKGKNRVVGVKKKK